MCVLVCYCYVCTTSDSRDACTNSCKNIYIYRECHHELSSYKHMSMLRLCASEIKWETVNVVIESLKYCVFHPHRSCGWMDVDGELVPRRIAWFATFHVPQCRVPIPMVCVLYGISWACAPPCHCLSQYFSHQTVHVVVPFRFALFLFHLMCFAHFVLTNMNW